MALRRRGGGAGVVYDPGTESHYVLAADLVRQLSRNPRLRARGVAAGVMALPAVQRDVVRPVEEFFGRWLAFSDPPRQARVRRALAPWLTRAALIPALAGLPAAARTVADRAADGGDLVKDVAEPLSSCTTAILLDAREDELDVLVEASSALIGYLAAPGLDVEAAAAARHGIDRLQDVVTNTLLPRRGPVATALTELVEEATIDDTDVLAAYAQLLTGAMEPLTVALVGTLLAAADARETGDPDVDHIDAPTALVLLDRAIAAAPPFHFAPRVAAADLNIDGHAISEGERIVLNLLTASAELYGCPSGHAAPQHLAFGAGTHYCLGATATRLHVELVLPKLARLVAGIDRPVAVRAQKFGATVWERVPLLPVAVRNRPAHCPDEKHPS